MILTEKEKEERVRNRVILSLVRPTRAENNKLQEIDDIHSVNSLCEFLLLEHAQVERILHKIFVEKGFGKKSKLTYTDNTYNCCCLYLTLKETVALLCALFNIGLETEYKLRVKRVAPKEILDSVSAKFYRGISTQFIDENYRNSPIKYIDYANKRLRLLSIVTSKEFEQLSKPFYEYYDNSAENSKLLEKYDDGSIYVIFSIPQAFAIMYALVICQNWEKTKCLEYPLFYRPEWAINASAIIIRGINDGFLPIIDEKNMELPELVSLIQNELVETYSKDIYLKEKVIHFWEDITDLAHNLADDGSSCLNIDPPERVDLKHALPDAAKTARLYNLFGDGKPVRKAVVEFNKNSDGVLTNSKARVKHQERRVNPEKIKIAPFIERKR